jgi:hypothetical protein
MCRVKPKAIGFKYHFPNMSCKNKQWVFHIVDLPITLKKYLKAKEEL